MQGWAEPLYVLRSNTLEVRAHNNPGQMALTSCEPECSVGWPTVRMGASQLRGLCCAQERDSDAFDMLSTSSEGRTWLRSQRIAQRHSLGSELRLMPSGRAWDECVLRVTRGTLTVPSPEGCLSVPGWHRSASVALLLGLGAARTAASGSDPWTAGNQRLEELDSQVPIGLAFLVFVSADDQVSCWARCSAVGLQAHHAGLASDQWTGIICCATRGRDLQ